MASRLLQSCLKRSQGQRRHHSPILSPHNPRDHAADSVDVWVALPLRTALRFLGSVDDKIQQSHFCV